MHIIKKLVTSLIAMGHMFPNNLSSAKSQDVKNECNIKGGT
jgi:hypothetical protein